MLMHPDAVTRLASSCGVATGLAHPRPPLKRHGRDNKLHVWKSPSQTPSTVRGSASAPPDDAGASAPTLSYSLDVNALNFCRFSLLPLDASLPSTMTTTESRAFVAVPNLVESSLASENPLSFIERAVAMIKRFFFPLLIRPMYGFF